MRAALIVTWIAALLATRGVAQDRVDFEPLPVLLVTGENNHDWPWTSKELRAVLEETGRFSVTLTESPSDTLADVDALREHRAIVLDYNGARWGEPAESAFLAAVRDGLGVVVVHAANNAFPGWREYEELVGLLWRDGTGHGRFHPFDVEIDDADHPITAGMRPLVRHPDELYHRLVNVHGVSNRVLGSAWSDPETGGSGAREPMIVVRSFGEGRVFHTPLGHVWTGVPQSRASWRDPQLRRLLARGTEWAATGAVALSPIPPNWLSPEEREQGFRRLFDGRSTDDWTARASNDDAAPAWSIDLASLHAVGSEPDATLGTGEPLGDFELRFEWATKGDTDAGVRYQMTGERTFAFEVRGGDARSGGLLGVADAEPGEAAQPGAFRSGSIVVRGSRIEHRIDGRVVLEHELPDPPSARVRSRATGNGITLVARRGEVWFRSLRLRASRAAEDGASEKR